MTIYSKEATSTDDKTMKPLTDQTTTPLISSPPAPTSITSFGTQSITKEEFKARNRRKDPRIN